MKRQMAAQKPSHDKRSRAGLSILRGPRKPHLMMCARLRVILQTAPKTSFETVCLFAHFARIL